MNYEFYKQLIINKTKEYLQQFNLSDDEFNRFIEDNDDLIKQTYEQNIKYHKTEHNFLEHIEKYGITDGLPMCLRLLY